MTEDWTPQNWFSFIEDTAEDIQGITRKFNYHKSINKEQAIEETTMASLAILGALTELTGDRNIAKHIKKWMKQNAE